MNMSRSDLLYRTNQFAVLVLMSRIFRQVQVGNIRLVDT